MHWYIYGDIFNRLLHSDAHSGYQDLQRLIQFTGRSDASKVREKQGGRGRRGASAFQNYFIFHQGLDRKYQDTGFDPARIFQPRGTVMDWQCSNCKAILPQEEIEKKHRHLITQDRILGYAPQIPKCNECQEILRPNIQLKDDLEFVEDRYEEESQKFEEFMQANKR